VSDVKHSFRSTTIKIPGYPQQSGLWEKWESSAFCWISKLGGKVRVLDFSTERLFPQPFGRRIFL